MKVAIAVHGTRGDIEPAGAVALELLRRGHEVSLAVPPNLVDFAASAGLPPAASYGVDSQQQLDAELFRDLHTVRNPITVLRESQEYIAQGYPEMSQTLTELAADADLILTGTTYQDVAGNVAEYHNIPLAALHYFPFRANRQLLAVPIPLPMPLVRRGFAVVEWGHWRLSKKAEDAQRRTLGLPRAGTRSVKRMATAAHWRSRPTTKCCSPGCRPSWARTSPSSDRCRCS